MSFQDPVVVDLKGVKKNYFHHQVLRGVNLTLKKGRFYTLLGENGSGKSTLLKMMMGAELADEGQIILLGQLIEDENIDLRRKIGLVCETIEFDMNGSLDLFFNSYQQFYPSWNQEHFHQMIQERKLDLRKRYKDLSRGQKMQLALIAALSISPDIIFVDEVTSVLDIYARNYFMSKLHQLVTQGKTVILTTNIISEVQHYTTDVLILNEGIIAWSFSMLDVPIFFKKIKKTSDDNHPIFDHPECFPLGPSSDGILIFLVPDTLFQQYEPLPAHFIDRRRILLEDVFVYLTQKQHRSQLPSALKKDQPDSSQKANYETAA